MDMDDATNTNTFILFDSVREMAMNMNITTIVKVFTPDSDTSLWKTELLNDNLVWELEKLIDLPKWTTRIESNTYWWIYPISIYLMVVHIGPVVMRNREPYKLNLIFNIWNAILAVFSILATVRIVPVLFEFLSQENGIHKTVCSRYLKQ